MSKYLLLVVICFCDTVCAAGAFGIEMGMTLEQVKKITGKEVKRITDKGEDDLYRIEPPIKNKNFDTYRVKIDEKYGVIRIDAIMNKVFERYESTLARETFTTIHESLSSVYGKSGEEMQMNDSTVAVVWAKVYGSKIPAGIGTIVLTISEKETTDYYSNPTKSKDSEVTLTYVSAQLLEQLDKELEIEKVKRKEDATKAGF